MIGEIPPIYIGREIKKEDVKKNPLVIEGEKPNLEERAKKVLDMVSSEPHFNNEEINVMREIRKSPRELSPRKQRNSSELLKEFIEKAKIETKEIQNTEEIKPE